MSIEARKIRLLMHLRRSGITDHKVLGALERVPRELFVPDSFFDQAYEDRALPIGHGQTISQPLVVAYMTQLLEVGDLQKVLEIGTGSGYQACILAKLCRRLYTVERYRPLLEESQKRFDALRLHNVTTRLGDGTKGWARTGPVRSHYRHGRCRWCRTARSLDGISWGSAASWWCRSVRLGAINESSDCAGRRPASTERICGPCDLSLWFPTCRRTTNDTAPVVLNDGAFHNRPPLWRDATSRRGSHRRSPWPATPSSCKKGRAFTTSRASRVYRRKTSPLQTVYYRRTA